jgi:hypothetical protein
VETTGRREREVGVEGSWRRVTEGVVLRHSTSTSSDRCATNCPHNHLVVGRDGLSGNYLCVEAMVEK